MSIGQDMLARAPQIVRQVLGANTTGRLPKQSALRDDMPSRSEPGHCDHIPAPTITAESGGHHHWLTKWKDYASDVRWDVDSWPPTSSELCDATYDATGDADDPNVPPATTTSLPLRNDWNASLHGAAPRGGTARFCWQCPWPVGESRFTRWPNHGSAWRR